VTLWRVSNRVDLSGEGGRRTSARWHTAGTPVVYLAASAAAALLEALVHELSLDELPDSYQCLEIDVDDERAHVAPLSPLPSAWRSELSTTRAVGDAWLKEAPTLLLGVPSVIVPKTVNYLLNPRHADTAHARIASVIRHPLDPRLIR